MSKEENKDIFRDTVFDPLSRSYKMVFVALGLAAFISICYVIQLSKPVPPEVCAGGPGPNCSVARYCGGQYGTYDPRCVGFFAR